MIAVLFVYIMTTAGGPLPAVEIGGMTAERCANLREMILLEHPDWKAECRIVGESEVKP